MLNVLLTIAVSDEEAKEGLIIQVNPVHRGQISFSPFRKDEFFGESVLNCLESRMG